MFIWLKPDYVETSHWVTELLTIDWSFVTEMLGIEETTKDDFALVSRLSETPAEGYPDLLDPRHIERIQASTTQLQYILYFYLYGHYTSHRENLDLEHMMAEEDLPEAEYSWYYYFEAAPPEPEWEPLVLPPPSRLGPRKEVFDPVKAACGIVEDYRNKFS